MKLVQGHQHQEIPNNIQTEGKKIKVNKIRLEK